MTGEEFAARRAALGYTQGALAALLGTSAPSLSRLEKAEHVPAELAQALERLQPSAGGGRGPYRASKPPPTPARKAPPPPARSPNAPRPAQLAVRHPTPEVVHEVDAIGAVLLEVPEPGSMWWPCWLRAVVGSEVVRQRVRERARQCQR